MVRHLGDPEALLRSHGLRVTRPRLAVIAVLLRARAEEAHLTVAEVAELSREILGRVSPQTVYDCLEAMTVAGLVDRVDIPGSPALFEVRTGGTHQHLVCRHCGAVRNVPDAAAALPDPRPELAPGSPVDHIDIVYWGDCAACAGHA